MTFRNPSGLLSVSESARQIPYSQCISSGEQGVLPQNERRLLQIPVRGGLWGLKEGWVPGLWPFKKNRIFSLFFHSDFCQRKKEGCAFKQRTSRWSSSVYHHLGFSVRVELQCSSPGAEWDSYLVKGQLSRVMFVDSRAWPQLKGGFLTLCANQKLTRASFFIA